MIKLRPITIILFLCAVAAYIVAPPLGVGLFVIGLLFELAGWVTVFRGQQPSKSKEE